MLKIPKELKGEWQEEYKVVSGYHGEFYLVILSTGLTMSQQYPSIEDAAINARNRHGSRIFEKEILGEESNP